MSTKLRDINQFHHMNGMSNFDYQSYMMKSPYDMYYNQNMMENMKSQGHQPENQPLYYRMNSKKFFIYLLLIEDFMRLFGMPDYFYRPGYPTQFEQEHKPKSDSIFNLINDKENLNRINKIANEGVNHIVAAFFIKSVQQSRMAKTNDNIIQPRRSSVTVNSVNLNEDANSQEFNFNATNDLKDFVSNIDTHPNELIENNTLGTNNNASVKSEHSDSPKKKSNGDPGSIPQINKYSIPNLNINTNIFNDKYSPDINEFTANQLNTVNDVVKKLKENKISEMIEKNYMNNIHSKK